MNKTRDRIILERNASSYHTRASMWGCKKGKRCSPTSLRMKVKSERNRQHMLLYGTHLRWIINTNILLSSQYCQMMCIIPFSEVSVQIAYLPSRNTKSPFRRMCLMNSQHEQRPSHQISMTNLGVTSIVILSTLWMSFHGGLKSSTHIQPFPVWQWTTT